MEGPEDPLPGGAGVEEEEGLVADRRGMISRAVEQVFSSAIQMRETGWQVLNYVLTHTVHPYTFIPYSRKYWRELNLAVESQIAIANILARFKFGGLVQDRHTYIR